MVDERTIQKYEKEAKDNNRESWFLAYIMDTNEEERAKVFFCLTFVDASNNFYLKVFNYSYIVGKNC